MLDRNKSLMKKPDNRFQFHSTESESRVSLDTDDSGIRVLEKSRIEHKALVNFSGPWGNLFVLWQYLIFNTSASHNHFSLNKSSPMKLVLPIYFILTLKNNITFSACIPKP